MSFQSRECRVLYPRIYINRKDHNSQDTEVERRKGAPNESAPSQEWGPLLLSTNSAVRCARRDIVSDGIASNDDLNATVLLASGGRCV
jgi:hypothetical protein